MFPLGIPLLESTPTNDTGINNLSSFIGSSPYSIQLLIVGGIVIVLFLIVLLLRSKKRR
jgi:hypothetical protein